MKTFRVAKCLENGEIGEYAIFADGSKKPIEHNDRYGDYFLVDNELNDKRTPFRSSFTGRIKDAVDTIKMGNGDCIKEYNLFGRHTYVVYFIDRNTGENLRQKFLNGWKDTKFAWTVECGHNDSYRGYVGLNKKTELISPFDEFPNPIYFLSEDEANDYVKTLIEKARWYVSKLANDISNVSDMDTRVYLFRQMANQICKDMETSFSVVLEFAFDMIDECGLKDTYPNFDKWGYKIVQCVIDENDKQPDPIP